MVAAYLGLGSNLDGPEGQVRRALSELQLLPDSTLISHSGLYRSRPLGGMDQPDYVNAVAVLETELEPLELLQQLQSIEAWHGRTRGERWGARTLDLDLLVYGTAVIDITELQVPHPGLKERAFVLYPLHEIAPDLEIPGMGRVAELLEDCSPDGLKKI
jgi:2-amino-4-hydroxy-6-hydroxymethyldihydropteridine diphosphokinase